MQQNSLLFFQPSDAFTQAQRMPVQGDLTLGNITSYFMPISRNVLPYEDSPRLGIRDYNVDFPQILKDAYSGINKFGQAFRGELSPQEIQQLAFDTSLNVAGGGLVGSQIPKAVPYGALGISGGKLPKITAKDIAVTDNLPIYGSKDFPVETLLGKKIIPFPADLLDAGRFYTGIDGVSVPPQPLQGGSLYSLMKQARDKNLAFANLDEKQARKAFDLNADYAVPVAMNPQSPGKLPSHFSNKNMGRIVGLQTKRFIEEGLVEPENVPKLEALIRSKGQTVKGAEKLANFVGFQSPKLIKYLDSLDFETRKLFSETLNQAKAREYGVPNLSRIGQATINPAEAGTNPMDALILLELQKGVKPVKVSDIGGVPHLSYDYAVLGRPVAKFEVPVPGSTVFPEFFAKRRLEGKPESSDARAFSMQKFSQIITPEIATGMATKRIGSINSGRHAQLLTDTINSNWRTTQTPVNQGGLSPADVARAFDDNVLSESLSRYSIKELQQGAKDGSLVFYGLGDAKTNGKVYFGLKKNTDYEADYGFSHPELTRNETAIVGVMNNEFGYASKGVSVPSSVLKGIENGATVLDAYAVRSKDYPDGFLPSYYAEFGFKKLGTVKFDPKYVREPEFGGSEQKYRRLLAQWRTQGWNEKFGFPDLVIMKWQGLDAIRKNATRRFLEEGTQGFRNRITKRTVGTARNLSGQSTTGSVGRKQQSGGKGDTRFNQGQVQTGNRTPVSEGFRRNIQSLTGATPEQLRSYGLLT